jgi:hypothetical protein
LLAVLFVGPLLGINVFGYLIGYPAYFLHGLLVG